MRSTPAVSLIIKINVIVFLLWIAFSFYDTPFMYKNFLVSWDALREGRVWTLISSEFSHNMLFHILINMYVFFGFGMALERHLGTKRFVIFYLTAAVVASLTHATVSAFLMGEPQLPALGASGAVAGVIMLFSLSFPKEKILLLGFIPLPAIWGAVLFVGLDLWGLIAQAEGTSSLPIGHGAHLGGALTGVIYYLFLRGRRSPLETRSMV